jgi:hypothetical protein
MIDYNQLIQWIFFGIVGFCATAVVWLIAGLRKSVDALNLNMATILTKIMYHEKNLDVLTKEVSYLRKKP